MWQSLSVEVLGMTYLGRYNVAGNQVTVEYEGHLKHGTLEGASLLFLTRKLLCDLVREKAAFR